MELTIRITIVDDAQSTIENVRNDPSLSSYFGVINLCCQERITLHMTLKETETPQAVYYLDQAGCELKGTSSRRSRSRFRSRRQRDEPYSRLKPRTHPRGWRRPGFSRNGTPLDFREKFISVCRSLQLSNCDEVWTAFGGAFRGRDPVKVMKEDYQVYFDKLPITAKVNSSLFWSGTFPVVEVVSTQPNPTGAVVYSSANEPSSAIINDLGYGVNWCGSKQGYDGLGYGSCLCSVTRNFWSQFSLLFAKASSGIAYWLGNGERNGGTFRNESDFSNVELPNMNALEVVAIILHRKGEGESCSEGSMNLMRSRVMERSIQYDCYDVYGDINQANTIAACVSTIISDIQKGMRPKNHEVDCI